LKNCLQYEVYLNFLRMKDKILDAFLKLESEIEKYNQFYDKEFIDRAFLCAQEHASHGQTGDDQLSHSLQVALLLTKIQADDVSIASALLYNALHAENSWCNVEEKFWAEVQKIVVWLQKFDEITFRIDMGKDEIEDVKKHLMLVGDDIRIFLVKIASRLHILRGLESYSKDKRYRIARETQEIYIPIVNFLSIGEFLIEMQELSFKYTHEEEYKRLYRLVGKKYTYHESKIVHAHDLLESALKKHHIPIVKIEGRIKTLSSIYKKMMKKSLSLNEIHDVLAMRVLTKTRQDCYAVLGLIHKIFQVRQERFKDYISLPKENGYQSIHTTVYDDSGELIEFQIQSERMYLFNNTGFAAHFIYKGFNTDFRSLPPWMSKILDVQKQVIDQKKFIEKLKDEIIFSEMRCFTHDGKGILLPKWARLLDFAFEVGHDEGFYFSEAIINGSPVYDAFYELKNGDFISLHKGSIPKIDYSIEHFFYVKTKKARLALKEIFQKHSKAKLIVLGKAILNNALELYSLRNFEHFPRVIKESVIHKFGFRKEEQLYMILALDGIDINHVVEKVASLTSTNLKNNHITIQVQTKTQDFVSLNQIITLVYNLDIQLDSLHFNRLRGQLYLHFSLDSKRTLDSMLSELRRVPNIASVRRIFPMRLWAYYGLLLLVIVVVALGILGANFFHLTRFEMNSFYNFLIVCGFLILLSVVFFLKYFIKKFLPDVLKYRRFWISLVMANTLILFMMFWEFQHLGYKRNFLIYVAVSIFMYGILVFDYGKYHGERSRKK